MKNTVFNNNCRWKCIVIWGQIILMIHNKQPLELKRYQVHHTNSLQNLQKLHWSVGSGYFGADIISI